MRAEEQKRLDEQTEQKIRYKSLTSNIAQTTQGERLRAERVERVLHRVLLAMQGMRTDPNIRMVTQDLVEVRDRRSRLNSMNAGIHGYTSQRKTARAERWLVRKAIPGWSMHETHATPGSPPDAAPLDRHSGSTYTLALATSGLIYAAHRSNPTGLTLARLVRFGGAETDTLAMNVDPGTIYQGLVNLAEMQQPPIDVSDI